jgi:hypothetical protein
MTTSPSPAAPSNSSSNGVSLSSLPRWRQFLSTLNWRRDPGYEQLMLNYEQRRIQHEQLMLHYERRKMQHELRMKQLESEILRVRSDSERIARETKQIEKETEQLRRENAREKALSALIEQHCFPDESNSIPLPPTEPGSSSS